MRNPPTVVLIYDINDFKGHASHLTLNDVRAPTRKRQFRFQMLQPHDFRFFFFKSRNIILLTCAKVVYDYNMVEIFLQQRQESSQNPAKVLHCTVTEINPRVQQHHHNLKKKIIYSRDLKDKASFHGESTVTENKMLVSELKAPTFR